ncbi:MAG TPA: hypothetical protein VF746_09095 [Longimicrobium sp.]
MIEFQGGEAIPLEFVLWTHAEPDLSDDPARVWILTGATKGLHDRLRNQRKNFVDLRGTVHLTFPNLLVDRSGIPPPPRRKSAYPSFDPFADRSSLVVRTLLTTGDRSWGVRELAGAAGVGPATVTRIVRELLRHRIVTLRRIGRGSHIRLTEPRGLFTLWTGAYDWVKNQSIALNAPLGDPMRFLRRSRSVFAAYRWALTMHAGASLVAPHASWERVHAYVDVEKTGDLLDLAENQGWPVAEEGRLVLMKPYYRDSVWHGMREIGGLPVVSDLQLALDLWHYPLRGREQAEHIIDAQHLFA